MNSTTAHREGFIGREEYQKMHAQNAGDRIEDLCQSVQDAVNEMIRDCRDHGRTSKDFNDLNIEVYAYPHSDGKVAWGINSLITGMNTKRGIVE